MIGIIGQGFVGNAVYQKFKKYYDVVTNDLDENKSTSTLPNLVMICDTIFLCLPTPMKESGQCDLSILENVLGQIDLLVDNLESEKISNNNDIKLFQINKDFIIKDDKIYITRETFINIAIKSDSIVGIQIFHQIMKFEDMIKKFIEISKKRRVTITHLINENRLKRAYNSRLSLPLTRENRHLKNKVKRLQKLIELN